MSLEEKLKDRNTLVRIGLVCLVIGNLLHLLARPTPAFGQGLIDGAFGLLTGLAIGCLLISLRRPVR